MRSTRGTRRGFNPVKIVVNGESVEMPGGLTVAELVEAHIETVRGARGQAESEDVSHTPLPALSRGRGLAVAVNAEVVPRSAWSQYVLREGDKVEILGASQGG